MMFPGPSRHPVGPNPFPGGVPPPGLITSMAGMPGLPPSAASLPPRLDMPPSVSLGNHLSGAPRPDHAAAAAAAASMAAAAAASQGGPPGQAAAAAAAAAANSAASNGPKSEGVPGSSLKMGIAETCERIKEEFNFIQNQYHTLKLECEKLAQEKTEMQRHYVMYYEMSYGLNVEMHKQTEICKRLDAIIRQVLPFLSAEVISYK